MHAASSQRSSASGLWLILLVLLGAVAAAAPPEVLATSEKSLLILNSYSPGYKWTDDIDRGLLDTIRASGAPIRTQLRFMDTKRVSDARYFSLLYQTYSYAFRNAHFDAVVTTDTDAFNFALSYRDTLFPKTPVVFCGVNDFTPALLHGAKEVTGVNEAVDLKATFDLALKLHPETRQIVVINDTTTTGLAVHRQIARLIPLYRGRVEFLMLEDLEMPAILAAVRELGPGSLVFYTFFSRDKAGRIFDSDESISMIASQCRVPIYGAWDFNLGYGIVGGLLTTGYGQGTTAGALAVRVLKGERAERIPVVMQSPNRYMFDYRQLQRFKIEEKLLPSGSIIVNRPPDSYRINRLAILAAAAALAGLVLIIAVLLHNIVNRRRAEEALHRNEEHLRRLNEELEERVRERTAELQRSQEILKEQNQVLQETYLGLQAETEDRIRVMEELRVKDRLLIHQSRMAAMGEMLGHIAHQWRQPLNVLGLQIQDLWLSYKLGHFTPELLQANVARSMEIVAHMSRTIDDFRTFSNPDKHKVPFRVSEVIAKTVSLIAEAFKSQGIAIETAAEGEVEIEGFPNEYAQVLMNILMNAKDAIQERQVAEGRIVVRASSAGGFAEVTISDNAGGIDESILEKIFDPYFTTKDAGKGTGVGLFMSKAIIEQNMGGRLEARNIPGGAEFVITVEEAKKARG